MTVKIGIFTILFSDWPAEKAFKHVSGLGYEMVEIGAGGYVPSTHLPDGTVDSIISGMAGQFKTMVRKYGLKISALSVHANHLDQNISQRRKTNEHFKKVIEAAEALEVSTVITFSGCPFDWGRWYSFPPENIEIYEKGWKEANEVWSPLLDFAHDNNVNVAIEVHPGIAGMAYNIETAARMLKEIPHKSLGFNFDPSHYLWQGIDPVLPIYEFSDRIFHVHAKDCEICSHWKDRSGFMVTGPWRILGRGWRFRVPGWGDVDWRRIITALLEIGYDNVLSFEHEDPVMSTEDGAKQCIHYLKPLIVEKPLGKVWWG